MRFLKLLITVNLIFCFATAALSEEAYNYGKGWNNISKEARLYWVWGFITGQATLLEEFKTKKTMKYDISDMDASVVSDIMTDYYNDPGNSYIPWQYMTYIAKMKLKGKKTAEIETELSLLREYSDYLRTEKQKPKK